MNFDTVSLRKPNYSGGELAAAISVVTIGVTMLCAGVRVVLDSLFVDHFMQRLLIIHSAVLNHSQ